VLSLDAITPHRCSAADRKEKPMLRLRAPSPALVVAVIALFVALSGTAVAAGVVPMAKRALFANNAGKLQGKSVRQIAALPGPASTLAGMRPEDIAELTGPASTASSLVSTASVPFALAPEEEKDVSAQCPSGAKALSGGYTTGNPVLGVRTRPTADGSGWTVYLVNLSDVASATGNVVAVCLR
jgi:hypothetical protein